MSDEKKFHLSQVFQAISTCSACQPGGEIVDKDFHCRPGNKFVNFFDRDAACPLNKWSSSIDKPQASYFGPPPQASAHKGEWSRIHQQAEQVVEAEKVVAAPKDPGLFAKATSILRAVASGKVDDATKQKRLDTCAKCPMRYLGRNGKDHYCNACGCGEWPPARLDSKLGWRDLSCPLNHW